MRSMRVLLSCVVLFAFSILAVGQTGGGSIQGTVTDSTGAMVSDAQITAVNTATNASRAATSSATGSYALPNLPVGPYTLTIEKTGFATAKLNVTVTVGDDTTTLFYATATDAQALAPIETESSQISNLVDSRRIRDLPLLTRNPYQLALLSPGTSTTTSGLGGFSVNGSRDRNNNFLLDGVDNNDSRSRESSAARWERIPNRRKNSGSSRIRSPRNMVATLERSWMS